MYIKYTSQSDGGYTIWKMTPSLYEEKRVYSSYDPNLPEDKWEIYYDVDDDWDDLLREDVEYIIDILTKDEYFLEMI